MEKVCPPLTKVRKERLAMLEHAVVRPIERIVLHCADIDGKQVRQHRPLKPCPVQTPLRTRRQQNDSSKKKAHAAIGRSTRFSARGLCHAIGISRRRGTADSLWMKPSGWWMVKGRKGKGEDGKAQTHEVKVAALFTEHPRAGEDPWRDMDSTTYVATDERCGEFGGMVRAEFLRRFKNAPEIIALGDAAEWIGNAVDIHFPQAIRIVDGHHFIGSGIVEAACKTIVCQRFKCSGMHWSISLHTKFGQTLGKRVFHLTMLTNKKRRAIHDFIAGTVVIKIPNRGIEPTDFTRQAA